MEKESILERMKLIWSALRGRPIIYKVGVARGVGIKVDIPRCFMGRLNLNLPRGECRGMIYVEPDDKAFITIDGKRNVKIGTW